MALPRTTAVLISVGSNASAVDLSQDLLELVFTESTGEGTLLVDLKLDDTNLTYRNASFLKKGTVITIQIQMLNWSGNSGNPLGGGLTRSTGPLWIDTADFELSPRWVMFKATSVSPDLEKGGKKHSATEGTNTKTQISQTTGHVTLIDASAATTITDPHKRSDQENESDLAYAKRKAEEIGAKVMVSGGQITTYKEADYEAKAPMATITDDPSSAITTPIRGRWRTTNQGKCTSGKIQHVDPQTGKVVTQEANVTLDPATNAANSCKAKHNSRKRPNYVGPDNNPDKVAGTPINTGAPGELA